MCLLNEFEIQLFKNTLVTGCSVVILKQAMSKSSPLKAKVLSALVKSFSPSKKKNIFSDARRNFSFNPGQLSKVLQNKDSIIAFLEQLDIGY